MAPIGRWAAWIALFPWLVAATIWLVRSPGPLSVAGIATASGLIALAGHPESALVAVSGAAVVLLVLLAADRRGPPGPGSARR